MTTSAGSRLAPPIYTPDSPLWSTAVGLYLREAHQGHLGNVGNVTLSFNSLSTEVVDSRVGVNSCLVMVPLTQNAAGSVGSTWISSRSAGGFTITHLAVAVTDRNFSYAVLG